MISALILRLSLAQVMPGVILALSVAALLQFFISYSRSLIAASAKQALSAEVQDVTGISRAASGDDFVRVIQLLRLCPAPTNDRSELRTVSTYFRFLGFLRSTIGRLMPSLRNWTESEQGHCAYFAAVALGRRIAFSRDMLAEQIYS